MSSPPSASSRRSDASAPLRRDVRLLGTILGNVLVEQEGEWLLQLVERTRHAARAARDEQTVEVEAFPSAHEQVPVLRAFGRYFQLANLAEHHHRLRRRGQA